MSHEADIGPQQFKPGRTVTWVIIGLVVLSAILTGVQFIWWHVDNVDEVPNRPGEHCGKCTCGKA